MANTMAIPTYRVLPYPADSGIKMPNNILAEEMIRKGTVYSIELQWPHCLQDIVSIAIDLHTVSQFTVGFMPNRVKRLNGHCFVDVQYLDVVLVLL